MKPLVDRIEEASRDPELRADVAEFLAKIARTIRAPRASEEVRFVAALAGREALRLIREDRPRFCQKPA
jgi:predicted transcriptional regulator